MKELILSNLDVTRIRKAIDNAVRQKKIRSEEVSNLLTELSKAKVVAPEEIPGDVVTMNSIVSVSFLNTKKTIQIQLVYPDMANFRENKISIFSPVATALIGYKAGDEIEWIVPSGLTSIKIEKIIYQPEAAGDFDL
ncbi:MAG TPA: nucleoside diphosphate kinase regulator [Bacteroidales bacterium]|nr:nucleoside diphosphate kinase regulator [Bacteroidales bacterium]